MHFTRIEGETSFSNAWTNTNRLNGMNKRFSSRWKCNCSYRHFCKEKNECEYFLYSFLNNTPNWWRFRPFYGMQLGTNSASCAVKRCGSSKDIIAHKQLEKPNFHLSGFHKMTTFWTWERLNESNRHHLDHGSLVALSLSYGLLNNTNIWIYSNWINGC